MRSNTKMIELYDSSDKKPQFEISNNKNLIFIHVRTREIFKILMSCVCANIYKSKK